MNYYDNPALSYSKLKQLDDNVRLFYYIYILKDPKFQLHSDALRFGSAFDCYLTENNKFNEKWQIKNTATTKLNNCITELEYRDIQHMSNSVNEFSAWDENHLFYGHKLHNILDVCEKQKEIYNHDKSLDIDYKSKLDYLMCFENHYSIFDVKTTCVDNIEDFIIHITKFKYYLQVGMYSMNVKQVFNLDYYPDFYFIGVSKKTYQCWVLKASFDMLNIGIKEIKRLSKLYINLNTNNSWLHDIQCNEVDILPWRQKQIEF